jgi:hypothetical protein
MREIEKLRDEPQVNYNRKAIVRIDGKPFTLQELMYYAGAAYLHRCSLCNRVFVSETQEEAQCKTGCHRNKKHANYTCILGFPRINLNGSDFSVKVTPTSARKRGK